MSGPMVRSSYRAGMLWGRAMVKRGWPIPERLAQLAEPATARQEASALLGTHPHLDVHKLIASVNGSFAALDRRPVIQIQIHLDAVFSLVIVYQITHIF